MRPLNFASQPFHPGPRTTRPGIDEKWFAGVTRMPQTSRMTLSRLGPKDLALLLMDSFRSEQLAAESAAAK